MNNVDHAIASLVASQEDAERKTRGEGAAGRRLPAACTVALRASTSSCLR